MLARKAQPPAWLRWDERQRPIHPLVPTALVLVYALWVVYRKLALHGFDPMAFVDVDGWFVYNLANSLPSLDTALDVPAYRAQRILLSLMAAPFRPFVPQALIAINLLALALGTYALAALAAQQRVPVLLGCAFGLWVGALFVIQLSLTEVLAYALVAAGLRCWERGRLDAALLLCGLAVLAKETCVLFALALVLGQPDWRPRRLARAALLALGPGAFWQAVVFLTFGSAGIAAGASTAGARIFPLLGLIYVRTEAPWAWSVQLLWVLLPALVAAAWGAVLLLRRLTGALAWALLLNGLFVMSLPPDSTNYLAHSMRIALAVVVALAWAAARTRSPRAVLLFTGLMLVPLIFFTPGFYF